MNELRLGRKPSDQLQAEAVYTNAAIAGVQLSSPPLDDNEAVEVIRDGALSKTTITYKGETTKVGPTRQRHFRLTEGAIEYFHQFSLVSSANGECHKAMYASIFELLCCSCVILQIF